MWGGLQNEREHFIGILPLNTDLLTHSFHKCARESVFSTTYSISVLGGWDLSCLLGTHEQSLCRQLFCIWKVPSAAGISSCGTSGDGNGVQIKKPDRKLDVLSKKGKLASRRDNQALLPLRREFKGLHAERFS